MTPMTPIRTAALALALGLGFGLLWPAAHAQSPRAPAAPVWDRTSAGRPVGLLAVAPAAAAALQVPPITNPSSLTFSASSDHNATGGTPAVPLLTNYAVEILDATLTTGVVIRSANISKPTPNAAGDITWGGVAAFRTTPTVIPNGSYVFRVAAEGPGGRNVSVMSDPFSWGPVLPGAPQGPGKPRINQ